MALPTLDLTSAKLDGLNNSNPDLSPHVTANGTSSARPSHPGGIHHQPTAATIKLNKGFDSAAIVESNSSLEQLSAVPISPKCDVSTINVNGRHSLLVSNDSCSISLKDSKSLYTLTPSSVDGLAINDMFKLANDDGILCYISSANLPQKCKLSDLKGLFVCCRTKSDGSGHGHAKSIKSNDEHPNTIYAPEVCVTSTPTSMVLGVVKKIINGNYYTKNNRVYSIAEHKKDTPNTSDNEDEQSESTSKEAPPKPDNIHYYFLVVQTSGIVKAKTKEEKIKCGQVYSPSKEGYAKRITNDEAGQKLSTFCINNYVPRIKAIKRLDDTSLLGILFN